MTSVVIYLDSDPLPARRREFLKVARDEHSELQAVGQAPYPAHTGRHLIDLAARAAEDAGGPIDHMALIMHGSTAGLLRPGSGHGIHVSESAPPRCYNMAQFARTWRPILADGALISLCACLCTRSPSWWLAHAYGRIPPSWGPVSYKEGGKRGFAGRLRDAFVTLGRLVNVRGHTVVGHVTGSPMLRHFGPELGSHGKAFFELALPGIEPTLSNRRRWVKLVKGRLARDWLMGDDEAIDRVRSAWGYEGYNGAVS